jgi:hypothetical protein
MNDWLFSGANEAAPDDEFVGASGLSYAAQSCDVSAQLLLFVQAADFQRHIPPARLAGDTFHATCGRRSGGSAKGHADSQKTILYHHLVESFTPRSASTLCHLSP